MMQEPQFYCAARHVVFLSPLEAEAPAFIIPETTVHSRSSFDQVSCCSRKTWPSYFGLGKMSRFMLSIDSERKILSCHCWASCHSLWFCLCFDGIIAGCLVSYQQQYCWGENDMTESSGHMNMCYTRPLSFSSLWRELANPVFKVEKLSKELQISAHCLALI